MWRPCDLSRLCHRVWRNYVRLARRLSNGLRSQLGDLVDAQTVDDDAVLTNVPPELRPAPQLRSGVTEAHLDDLHRVASDRSRFVAPGFQGAGPIVVVLVERVRPGDDHVDIAVDASFASCPVAGRTSTTLRSALVFVIAAKKYTGQVEARNVGGPFRTDVRLYVNNRDRTKLVEGVLRQVDVVRAALGEDFADVEVRGVLCFVGCEWGWIMRTKRVKGVTALWPTALPDHVSVAGGMSDRVTVIADRLRSELRPAT